MTQPDLFRPRPDPVAMFRGSTEPRVRRFVRWHDRNPEVYVLFRRFAREALARGMTALSADAVLHRVRWETSIETRGDGYKVNNTWSAFMARALAAEDPRFRAAFRFRDSVADVGGA